MYVFSLYIAVCKLVLQTVLHSQVKTDVSGWFLLHTFIFFILKDGCLPDVLPSLLQLLPLLLMLFTFTCDVIVNTYIYTLATNNKKYSSLLLLLHHPGFFYHECVDYFVSKLTSFLPLLHLGLSLMQVTKENTMIQ